MFVLSGELCVEVGVALGEVVRPEEFGGSDAPELVGDARDGDLRDPEATGGEIDPSDPGRDSGREQRGEEVVLLRIEDLCYGHWEGCLGYSPLRTLLFSFPCGDIRGFYLACKHG